MAFGIVYNEYYDGSSLALSGLGVGGKTFVNEYSWDSSRARACVCDAGWTGLGCQQRMCPYGNDIMDVIPGFDENSILGMPGFGNEMPQVQTVTLYDDIDNNNFVGKSFAIQSLPSSTRHLSLSPSCGIPMTTSLLDTSKAP